MVCIREAVSINSGITRVWMDISDDLWEKIRNSEEWRKILAGNVSKEGVVNKLTDEVDSVIESVCDRIREDNFTTREYADTVRALASLVEARARLFC